MSEAWEEEKGNLIPLPARPWPCCLTRPAKVTLSSTLSFDNNRYSVLVTYAGSSALVRAWKAWNRVRVYWEWLSQAIDG